MLIEKKQLRVFSFIFARMGSKGLPGKNTKPFCGKPLVAWSIEMALSIPKIERVFLSTDGRDIANIGKKCGAEIIDRPPDLATDRSPEWLSWKHAIQVAEHRYGSFELFVSLPPTSPLRTDEDVLKCIDRADGAADAAICLSESGRNPWFNIVVVNESGLLRPAMRPAQPIFNRQDAPVTYDVTTIAYAVKPNYIKTGSSLWGGRVKGVVVPQSSAVDIDTIDDFQFAEFLMKRRLAD